MRNDTGARCALFAAILAGIAGFLTPTALSQDGGMEVFEEVDPYTKGDSEKMAKLGYTGYGPFLWHAGERTVDLQQNLGGVSMLFVETEHFKIASSLVTYDIPNDRDEKDRLDEEIKRLKKKLGRLKAPKKELDPWLRLHLYAQRAEDLYASFSEDFGLEPADYENVGPHLGHPEKFHLLLCERKSEFGRYVRTYLKVENEHSLRWIYPDGGLFYGASIEAIRGDWEFQGEEPWDSMLHCEVVSGMAANFVDAYRKHLGAPQWLSSATGHLYSRRIDPRWVPAIGYKSGESRPDESWEWEPRVQNLVKNDFFAKTEELFGWMTYDDLDKRDHMVAWSRLEYLMEETDGDLGDFLAASARGPAEEVQQYSLATVERQTKALESVFGLAPAELDEAWEKWVKKTYKKR